MFIPIINNLLSQIFFFVILIGAVGYLISLCNKLFYTLTGNAKAVCYATGFIGTPIHELSHAAMCVVFMHRIDEMKLFQIGDDGTLGYVKHSYDEKNIYQKIGNYFISVAPVVLGGAVLLLAMSLLAPDMYKEFSEYIEDFAYLQSTGVGSEWLAYALVVLRGTFVAIISGIGNPETLWFLFIILALCIAIHMNLSGQDIKVSLSALPMLIGVLAVVNFALGFILPKVYAGFVSVMCTLGGYLSGMLMISLILSVFALLVAALIRGVILLVKAFPDIIKKIPIGRR